MSKRGRRERTQEQTTHIRKNTNRKKPNIRLGIRNKHEEGTLKTNTDTHKVDKKMKERQKQNKKEIQRYIRKSQETTQEIKRQILHHAPQQVTKTHHNTTTPATTPPGTYGRT